jgi:hypothetical protein
MRRLESRVKSETALAGGGVFTTPLGEVGRATSIGPEATTADTTGSAESTAADVTATWEQQSALIRGADSWQAGADTPAVGCSRHVQHTAGAAPRRSNAAARSAIDRVMMLSR